MKTTNHTLKPDMAVSYRDGEGTGTILTPYTAMGAMPGEWVVQFDDDSKAFAGKVIACQGRDLAPAAPDTRTAAEVLGRCHCGRQIGYDGHPYAPCVAEIVTRYGTATIGPDFASVKATGAELSEWASRPGSAWPCSSLTRMDSVSAGFDANGLVSLESDPDVADRLPSDELNAWTSDVLGETLPDDHPVWFVCVGQFRG